MPAASRLACSDDAPQATVALRFTPEIFMIACEKRAVPRAKLAKAQSQLSEVAGVLKRIWSMERFHRPHEERRAAPGCRIGRFERSMIDYFIYAKVWPDRGACVL